MSVLGVTMLDKTTSSNIDCMGLSSCAGARHERVIAWQAPPRCPALHPAWQRRGKRTPKVLLDDYGGAVAGAEGEAAPVGVDVAVAVDVAAAGVLARTVFSTVVSTVSSTVTVRGGGGWVASS